MPETRSRTEFSVQSLDDVSRFLRSGLADEDSRQLRESLGGLAQHIDDAVRLRRRASAPPSGTGAGAPIEGDITQRARALAQCLREHQRFLTGLGSAWYALYEMGAYQNALRNLQRAVDAWLDALVQRRPVEGAVYARLEPLAWRTLGEGMLLIDMYEQGDVEHSEPPPAKQAPPRGAVAWAGRFWRWVRGSR